MKNIRSTLSGLTLAVLTITCGVAQSNYEPYTFTTLAGGGAYSTNAAGVVARARDPVSLGVDRDGNVYVAEQGNNTISKITPSGVVSTFAGRPGSLGSADGVGNTARFNQPSCLTVDNLGNVLVGDTGNCTIRKITPEGEVTTLAGLAGTYGGADGTGSDARFNYPWGIAVDNSGTIYVADSDNNTIRKMVLIGNDWVVTTIAGRAGSFGSVNGTGSAARFNFPDSIVVDSAGTLYVADGNNQTIRQLTPDGTNWVVTTIAGRAGSAGSADGTNSNSRFNGPNGLVFDSAHNLYVGDWGSSTVRKMTRDGTNWVVKTIAGLANSVGNVNGTNSEARFNLVSSLGVDSAGNVYVADAANSLIRKMTLKGADWVVSTFAGLGGNYGANDGPASTALFEGPSGVALDSSGNTYVADQINHSIRKIDPAGEVTTIAGQAGYAGSTNGTNNTARFNNPFGVAVNNSGTIYIVDAGNHTIRKMTPAGTDWVVTTLAGSPDPTGNGGSTDAIGTAARFSFPRGVALDTAGNLYVADCNNATIRKVTPSGIVTTRAGSAGQFGSKDGTGTAARFNSPFGVAVDSATNIYVADTYNHTIRKVSPARVVTTLAGSTGTPGSADGIGNDARFDFPAGIAVDNSGNLYVADLYNSSIRKLTLVGENWVVTTLGGMSGFFGTTDGTGSSARFANPLGIAVDASGNLCVVDNYLSTIRKGFPAPRITNSGFQGSDFWFDLSALAGKTLIIESTTDLTQWHPIETNVVTSGLRIRDAYNKNDSGRFYRFRLP